MTDPKHSDFGKRVKHQTRRKLKARQRKNGSAWFGLGMFGLVGWSVAVPSLVGVLLGMWLDERWPGQHSWVLTLLIVGVVIGCLNAWYWVSGESSDD